MAESYVPFLDSASATRKFHTYQRSNGSDTVEEYVQVTGEPYLATYAYVPTTAVSTATANSHLLQIMAGGSLRVGIRRILVWQTANGTTQVNTWGIYRLSTAGTGGGSVFNPQLDPADASAGSAGMTLPTAKGTEGSCMDTRTVLTHATAATVGLNPIADFDFRQERTKALWIPAGTSNGIALKNITSSASTTVTIVAWVVESAEGA